MYTRLLLCLSTFFLGLGYTSAQLPVIQTQTDQIDIRDGKEYRPKAWRLVPEAKPDTYETVAKGEKTISFITDIDSISYTLKPGDSEDFIILLHGKDSCWTRIAVFPDVPAAQFSKSCVKENKGKYSIEIPEVQELVHILMAITPTGIGDFNMINHTGDYYKEVMDHFGSLKEHPIVEELDKALANGQYARIKMDACGFFFEGEAIKKDPNYDRLNWGRRNLVEPYLPYLEAIAKASNFRAFFESHQAHYRELITQMEKQSPVHQQWDWLEKQFSSRYDHYRITFSPLVFGSHSTNRFETEDFKQTVMFTGGPRQNYTYSDAVAEGLTTRMVFTEIDHNYVNPVSDIYLDDINEAMGDRAKWVTEGPFTGGYSSPYAVFNEYMTWAVFSCYAMDRYDEKTFKEVNDRVVMQMAAFRGFKNFKTFNDKLLELFENLPKGKKVEDLYPEMLAWCKTQ